ncbi:hypothetical protein HG537_0A05590 [Torulaspora globosa]|uniref:GPI transamidase component PIG-S n=1 Tax=Torulaspora globosa TaxID=48254 RepID=A0A7H9HPS2_9SACH|nr:hypothetical protein HG537_0A05590 [Torulaspora sp. CBS 2947]
MLDNRLRKIVGLCFLACYVLLGVPLWYKLTTVYRAPLPVGYIRSLHEDKFKDVHMVIPVFIKSEVYRFPDIHDAVQVQVNHLLNSKEQYVSWSLQILPYEEYNATGSKYSGDEYHVVSLVLDEFVGYSVAYDAKETTVFFDDAAVLSNDVPFFVAQSLVEHTFGLEWQQLSSDFSSHDDNMVVPYNPNMHLSISLLSGDGSPVRWEIDKTLQHYFTPFRKFVAPLVNFTVDTSIIYYNDLNVHVLAERDSVTSQELSHTIDLSELSSMNHLPESSALNLAIVFPSNTSCPSGLNFIHDSEPNWQSFIVPQWGNLIINKNPLLPNALLKESYLVPIMYQFATDLFQLLGLAKGSQDLSSPYITIDSFKRLTTLRNIDKAEETLWSLVKLTQSFKQMAVPQDVLNNVNQALKLRLQIIDLLNDPQKGGDLIWNQALVLSNKLVKASETAFFHGEMVQQNFFPQEHKIAVYLPLLGPTSVVIFLGLVKLLKERNVNEVKQDNPEVPEKLEKQGNKS